MAPFSISETFPVREAGLQAVGLEGKNPETSDYLWGSHYRKSWCLWGHFDKDIAILLGLNSLEASCYAGS